ncbi:uncharacterized protein LTR77_010885 [Saxophila tyrrhenica]|uniref:Uncharacterized protein n=1 Tax=Saxophila tyrrhenica TaxID=1690608 RepID=A0AAV9NTW8_9PEZI|nr:hypothetical protein LTR77_010885 [Saxophila tyrrhenica]
MSSEQRASSAVRNLRSMFENKAATNLEAQNSPEPRGRSPGALGGSKDIGLERPTSKVRASFVSVEPSARMATEESISNGSPTRRRGSFVEADADLGLRKTISEHHEAAPEKVVESAVGTPKGSGDEEATLPAEDDSTAPQEPANPDKPVTAAEEEPSEMQPADPTSEQAVSGGEALPPVAEDLRATAHSAAPSSARKTSEKGRSTNSKPPAISTKASTKPSSSAKSPASQPKTPQSSTAQPKVPAKKASRSSLTAPTAASMARSGAGTDHPSKTSPSSGPKKREPTKPVSLPSHLTAPTASSRAKHDPTSASGPSTTSKPTTSRPKPSSTRPTPRTSLAPAHRPGSQTSHTSAPAPRRSMASGDNSSFLERMMKPTAASASKTHEKSDAKSPPSKSKTTSKPKTNGTSSKPAAAAKTAPAGKPEDPVPEAANESSAPPQEPSTAQPIPENSTGNETPLANGHSEQEAATLEATPAGMAGEETIR